MVGIDKVTGGNWVCKFADEFSSTGLDRSKWVPQTAAASGFHSGNECFVDNSKNISVASGYLTVLREAAPFSCASQFGNYDTQYTSGRPRPTANIRIGSFPSFTTTS